MFSDESELIYKQEGLEAFYEKTNANAENAMNERPFARNCEDTFLKLKKKMIHY